MRPSVFKRDTNLVWVIRLRDPLGQLIDASSLPSVAVRKNGVSVADSVVVVKRTGTTGIYDATYNPAGEIDGDLFTFEEQAIIAGVTYTNSWSAVVDSTATQTVSSLTPEATASVRHSEIMATITPLPGGIGNVPTNVWTHPLRTLTSFGSLVADIVTAIRSYLFGSGHHRWSITVELNSSPVPAALVRVTRGTESYLGQTNASGKVVFNVTDGDWFVTILSSLGTFTGETETITDDTDSVYELSAAVPIVPSDPDKVTGYWLCLDENGMAEANVTMAMTLYSLPPGSMGLAVDSKPRHTLSGLDGVASFANLLPGCRYACRRGTGQMFYVTIPPDVDLSQPLPLNSLIGN